MNWGQFKDVLCYLFFNGCVVTLWSAKGGCKLKYQIILSIATFQQGQLTKEKFVSTADEQLYGPKYR